MKTAARILLCLVTMTTAAPEHHSAEHMDQAGHNKEHIDHGAHNPMDESHFEHGEHNMEYDHEAVLGSRDLNEEFGDMTPEEAKKGLARLVVRMDENSDQIISKEELSNWVIHSFRMLDTEEAEERMKEQDENGDETISWAEYMSKVYGYLPEEVKDWDKDKTKEMQDIARMMKTDMDKFQAADRDHNNKLNKTEYAAFLHPYDFEHMFKFEIDRTMGDYDKNKDGFIDLEEYLGDIEHRPNKDQLEHDKENFDAHDKNGDKKLGPDEITSWAIPDHKELAQEEADHLISETDSDGDKQLTKDEILAKHDLWVGSQVTDYGRHLKVHDPEEL